MPREKRKRRKERDEILNSGGSLDSTPAPGPAPKQPAAAEESKKFQLASPSVGDDVDEQPVKPKTEGKSGLSMLKESVTTRVAAGQSTRYIPPARKQKDKMAAVQWKYVCFGAVGVMFLAFVTHLFSINGGLVLNDRACLGYLFSTETMQQVAEQSITDLTQRPLTMPWTKASLLTDRGDWGTQFVFFHMSNLLMHMAATGYFFFFLVRFGRHLVHQGRLKLNPYYIAIAAAGVFATHPMACQAVSYLSARAALLGTVNYFLCLNCLLVGLLGQSIFVRAGGYCAAIFAGLMALWSNPETISLPLICVLVILLLRGPLKDYKESAKQNPFALGIVSLVAIASPALILRGVEYPDAVDLASPYPTAIGYWATQIKAFVFYYLRSFLFPFGLSVDPPAAVATSFTDPWVLGGLGILGLLIAAIFRYRLETIVGFGLALVAAAFIPHALMIQKDQVADWVAYFGLAGFSLLFAWMFVKVAVSNFRKALVLFAAVIFLFIDLSIFRDSQWGSDLSLWKTALEQRPKSARAHAMYAIELVKRKRIEEAEKEMKLALAYKPDSCSAHLAEGRVLLAQKKYAEAEKAFTTASELATSQALPQAVQSECRFGILEAMIRNGRAKDSQAIYDKLFQDSPGDPRLFHLLSVASLGAGHIDKAYKFAKSANQLDPTMPEALEMAANLTYAAQAYPMAYEDALKWQTVADSHESRLLLARIELATKRNKQCAELLTKMLTENPKDAEAMLVKAYLAKVSDDKAEFEKLKAEAIKLDPKVEEKVMMPTLPEKETPKETPKEAPKATPKEEAPAETPKEGSSEAPKETPKEAPAETPKESSSEAPKETAPKEAPKDQAPATTTAKPSETKTSSDGGSKK